MHLLLTVPKYVKPQQGQTSVTCSWPKATVTDGDSHAELLLLTMHVSLDLMYSTQNRNSFLATQLSLESRLGLTQLSSWDSRFILLGDTELLFLSLQILQASQEAFSHAEQTSCGNTLFPSVLPIGNSSQVPPARVLLPCRPSVEVLLVGHSVKRPWAWSAAAGESVLARVALRGEAQENDTEQAPSVAVKDATLALQSFGDSTVLHPSKWTYRKGPLCSGLCWQLFVTKKKPHTCYFRDLELYIIHCSPKQEHI